MNNNPTKGGTPGTFQIVKSSPGLEDFWQLHYSEFVAKDVQSPDNFIANFTKEDGGAHIKVTARSDGSFTVKNGRNRLYEGVSNILRRARQRRRDSPYTTSTLASGGRQRCRPSGARPIR
jgi:hypothetical protein